MTVLHMGRQLSVKTRQRRMLVHHRQRDPQHPQQQTAEPQDPQACVLPD
jgi:hypothetical protein